MPDPTYKIITGSCLDSELYLRNSTKNNIVHHDFPGTAADSAGLEYCDIVNEKRARCPRSRLILSIKSGQDARAPGLDKQKGGVS